MDRLHNSLAEADETLDGIIEFLENDKNMTETEKFKEWYEAERAKGLVVLNFCVGDVSDSTVESFCAEINRMLAAPNLEDPDTF